MGASNRAVAIFPVSLVAQRSLNLVSDLNYTAEEKYFVIQVSNSDELRTSLYNKAFVILRTIPPRLNVNATMDAVNHGFLGSVSETHHSDNDPILASENSYVAFHPFINPTAKSQGKSRVYSKAEWEIKRDIIKTLYWDERKTLCEVMSIMAKEHDFHATQVTHLKSAYT